MPEVVITAEPRTEFGKGPARRIREDGRIPAVLYGHHTEPLHMTLPGHQVLMAMRTANVLIRLEGLPGGSQLALPRDIQRDPIKGWVEHLDLLLVRQGEKVTVEVPVTLAGEAAPGGLVDQQVVQVSVQAEATHIPAGIEVSIEGMDVGDAVHAGELKLPAGVTLDAEADLLIVHVIAAPTAEQIEAELGEAKPEGEEEKPEGEGGEAEAEHGDASTEDKSDKPEKSED